MLPHNAKFASEDLYDPDGLLAGNSHRLLGRTVRIRAGQNLARGAVLGRDSAGKYLLSEAAAGDGSETPGAILAEHCDASDAEREAIAYFRGDFNRSALTLGVGHTLANITEGLRSTGIVLLDTAPI